MVNIAIYIDWRYMFCINGNIYMYLLWFWGHYRPFVGIDICHNRDCDWYYRKTGWNNRIDCFICNYNRHSGRIRQRYRMSQTWPSQCNCTRSGHWERIPCSWHNQGHANGPSRRRTQQSIHRIIRPDDRIDCAAGNMVIF